MKTVFTKSICFLLALMMTSGMLVAQTYWGANPGEGDFDGGFNGWTVESIQDDSVFLWKPNGLMTGGLLGGQGESLNSPTASNGTVLFNADYFSTAPTGDIPPPPYPQYVCDLISPVIDLSGVDASTRLDLQYYQMYRRFQAADGFTFTSYSVSTDGGTTWSPRVDASPDLPQTTGGNGVPTTNGLETVQLPFTAGLAGSDNVRIKFTFAGNFYFWGIDDISIVKRPDNDTRISSGWYAAAPYAQIPLSQIESMSFMADVENIGSLTAANTELNMDVTQGGSSVYNTTYAYGDLIPDSLAENEVFGDFTPDSEGTYTGTYTLSTDSTDINPTDNSFDFSWNVTETVFAKETGATRIIRPGDGNWDDAEPKTWTYGNHFYITTGDGYESRTASFIVQGDAASNGQVLNINLWKWTPPLDLWEVDPVNAEFDCVAGDRVKVGFGSYTVATNNTLQQIQTVDLIDQVSLEPGVLLENNTHYVLMVEYNDIGAGNVVNLGGSEAINYAPAIYASRINNAARMASMLGISSDLESEPFSDVGFGQDIAVCVRMNVTEVEDIPDSTVDILEDASLDIFPSPANAELTVDVALAKQYDDAIIRVVDVRGTTIMEQNYGALQNERLILDPTNWTTGTYFLQVVTAEGVKTKHFVVQH